MQALRAAAAMMVVVYHMVHAEDIHGGGITLMGGPAHFGYAGVDVFFVISGFIMATVTTGQFGNVRGAVDFTLRRTIRIVPLYWICTLAIAVILKLRPGALSDSFSGKSLLASLLMVPQDGGPLLAVGWTLTYELFFYAMTAVALAIGAASQVSRLLVGWAIVLLLLQLAPAHGPWTNVLTSPLAFEFIVGALAGLHWKKLPATLAWPAIGFGIIWMTTAGFMLIDAPGHGQSDGLRTVAFGLPAALVAIGLARVESWGGARPPAVLVKIGDASYSLYLTHLFVLSVASRIWSGANATGTVTGNIAFLISTFVACCATALIVHRLVEVPLLSLGSRAINPVRRHLHSKPNL